MWAWCRSLEATTQQQLINEYLEPMESLIANHRHITFVFHTSTLASGSSNVHARNQEISDRAIANNRRLYDFEDINGYDSDGVCSNDTMANENCDHDIDGDGVRDANWAIDWQESHTENSDWFAVDISRHTQAINSGLKAYAAWWLFVEIGEEWAADS